MKSPINGGAKDVAPTELSSRRTTFSFVKTLLWKNWVLKKRHPVATFLEIALPCLFILLMGYLKKQTTDVTVPAGWSDNVGSATDDTLGTSYNLFTPVGSFISWIPTTLPRFYMHETTLTGVLLSLGLQSIADGLKLNELSAADLNTCRTGVIVSGAVSTNASSPYKVPDACDGRVVPYKIAIAPDTTFTREYFMQTMDQWYPRIQLFNVSSASPQVPSFRDSVEFFKTADELETYVKSSTYGDDLTKPRIFGAIVFDQIPSDDAIGSFQSIEYSLRLNSTLGRRGITGLIPRTIGDPPALFPFQKSLSVDYYSRYAVSGFMTLQTLVTRFVTCMPVWDAATKTTTGACQRSQATAKNSTELDARLLATMNDDIRIQLMLSSLLGSASSSAGSNPLAEFLGVTGEASNLTLTSVLALTTPAVREALLKPLRQAPQPYLGSAVAPFPVESYVSSPFYDQVKNVFALVFVLAYLYCISRVLVIFIQEKESRIREYMKILGVKEKAIIMSWYITYGLILLVGTFFQALAGLVGLFENSSVFIVFLFFYLFGLSVLAFGFMVSTIFSKARVGAFVGMVLFFLMYFISSAFTAQTPENSKSIGCLLSPVALSLGVQVLANLEATGQGIAFANISTLSENFRFSTSLIFFFLDTVIYTVLGLYFEKVIPKQYGTTLKWYFPVSPAYWRGRKSRAALQKLAESPGIDNVIVDVNPSIEPVNADLREQERTGDVLSVQRLRKVFPVPGGEKVAVKGLNLAMYKDQITCLLGHNGAGKTTLISMLTGMIAPSSGTATFRGLSITEDMDEIRESLGICFQHDVLFAELTVEEHLILFGRIKGYVEDELREIVDKQIREVGLTEKRHTQSHELSGGMKRKLSVAVSLLGDSSLVFLDEPTSGMDPYSRRSTWEILLNNRNDRVMVLTTHFMDEADILGDRIAIMAEGELRCCGSSLFLKNRYGAGYNLTLVKDDKTCNDSEVINFIMSYVPNANVLSNVGSEIAFQLPLDSSSKFATMFAEMDRNLVQLGLLSYGVSVTTLEEVFIKVAEAGDEDNQHTLAKDARPVDSNSPVHTPTGGDRDLPLLGASSTPAPPRSLFFAHLHALFLKRLRVAKRDRRMLVFSAILPVLLLLAGLMLLKGSNITQSDPKLPLTADDYAAKDQSPAPYFCQADSGKWCSAAMSPNMFTGAQPEQLSSSVVKTFDSSNPTVFGVSYTNPAINATDATGYGLSLGQTLYNRGYGKDGADRVSSQYGAYLVHGESERNVLGYNVFVNTSSTHGAAIFKALMDQAVYRFFAANTSSTAGASTVDLKVNSHPLPLTASTKALFSSFLSFSACLFIVIAFTFFPASIVVFLVKEKQSEHNAKHQQLVSGVSLGAFWLSNYLWDLMMYIVPFAAAIILIQLFDIGALTGNGCVTCTSATFPSVVVLFLLFGMAICPFTYCMSYLFKEHASSQTYTIMVNFIIGVVLMVVSFILDVIESTKSANAVLIYIWRLSPLFNLGNGLLNVTLNELRSILNSDKEQKDPFFDLMGNELLFLLITTVLFSALAVGIDYALTFPQIKNLLTGSKSVEMENYEEDIDVLKEAERVQSGQAADEVVVLNGLRKVYKGGKVAVRNLSFGLKRGECFGFLGINGAGKTSTMKMLTGDVLPSSGSATLSGFDILTQQLEVRRQIGYCPQFDALFELLSVREHLELFARIKGVPLAELDDVVTDKINQLNLASFENKLAGSLSGGNKRKLSVAIAMIGNPQIVFLDEPSTGMDPVSRRFMWDVIAGISTRSKASTIVLTTHSMEESEALCSRVGIMVGGRLRCLGSVQHLKNRFGDGLVFDVKLTAPEADELQYLVEQHFGGGHKAFVTPMELADKCASFGDASFADRVTPTHPTGYSLAATLERDGFIRAEAFSSWFTEEKRFDELEGFLRRSFGDENVVVMERQNDFCRFKLRGSNDQLKLSKVFALVEEIKTRMHIREYSVSQTTLEQIFNQFASQQSEETGVARGMMGPE